MQLQHSSEDPKPQLTNREGGKQPMVTPHVLRRLDLTAGKQELPEHLSEAKAPECMSRTHRHEDGISVVLTIGGEHDR